VSVAVALADKIDTLTGFWAIDEKPTGSKDPFALRRAALGVIRLVLANEVSFPLRNTLTHRIVYHSGSVDRNELLKKPSEVAKLLTDLGRQEIADVLLFEIKRDFKQETSEKMDQLVTWFKYQGLHLLSFFHDRLKVYLRDQGIRHDVIDACLAMPNNDDLTLLVKRAEALSATLKTDDGTNLLQGFKRANNILTQAEAKDGVEYSYGPDAKLAETDAERALFAALDTAEATIAPAMQAEDFATAMTAMAALRAPIDAFFDAVQINAENPILRRNRLNLLHRIRATCGQVADLTKVDG
jgi:glycyl-tRNA synthetase beta chain